jgi:hypothetical protein
MFLFTSFVSSVYEDLVMCLSIVRSAALARNDKVHLKMVPLGVGPTIRTRYGDFLGPLLIPAYVVALQYAITAIVDDSWVAVLEFVDSMHGQLSPYVNVPHVQVLSGLARDAFDFSRSEAVMRAVIAPCDSFCRVGGSDKDKTLAATLANNSNLRDLTNSIDFIAWPQRTI